MEETLREAPPVDDWRGTLARTIEEQRRRVSERIAGQRNRLRDLESLLATQLEEATQTLIREQAARESAVAAKESAVTAKESEFASKERALAERQQELERQRKHVAQLFKTKRKELTAEIELHKAQALAAGAGQEQQLLVQLGELQGKYDRLREELEVRQQQRDEAQHKLGELQGKCDRLREELELRQQQRDEAQHKLGELMGQLDARGQEAQRQTSALQKRLDESQAELVKRTAEVEQLRSETTRLTGELERLRGEHEQQIEQLKANQGKSDNEKLQSFEKQLEEARAALAAERSDWENERKKLQADLLAAQKSGADAGAQSAELARLRQEYKQLESRLAAAQASGGSGDSSQEVEDLRRRFEMAVQDVRELKTKNAELTEQLAKARQNAQSANAGGTDWESLKQRMLAQLESDFDEGDEQSKQEKLTVEKAIQATEQAIAEKDNEIAELRRLLESQSQNMGEMAVGAAAIAGVLDTDELIRQEREALQQMQEKLREELRKAEVDNSLERAKLARERAELEERMRIFEEQGGMAATRNNGQGDNNAKKPQPTRGKWLARLGLQGKD